MPSLPRLAKLVVWIVWFILSIAIYGTFSEPIKVVDVLNIALAGWGLISVVVYIGKRMRLK